MPICGVNKGATFRHWKKWFLEFLGKLASFKRQFLREAVQWWIQTQILCTLCLWKWLGLWYGNGNAPRSPSFNPPCQCRSALRGSERASERASERKKSTVCVASVNPSVFCAVAYQVNLALKCVSDPSVCLFRITYTFSGKLQKSLFSNVQK